MLTQAILSLTAACFFTIVPFQCRHELTRRQVLMEEDVKVNRGLFTACRNDVKKNKCFHVDGMPKMKEARQSKVILCLEQAMKNGQWQHLSVSLLKICFLVHTYLTMVTIC